MSRNHNGCSNDEWGRRGRDRDGNRNDRSSSRWGGNDSRGSSDRGGGGGGGSWGDRQQHHQQHDPPARRWDDRPRSRDAAAAAASHSSSSSFFSGARGGGGGWDNNKYDDNDDDRRRRAGHGGGLGGGGNTASGGWRGGGGGEGSGDYARRGGGGNDRREEGRPPVHGPGNGGVDAAAADPTRRQPGQERDNPGGAAVATNVSSFASEEEKRQKERYEEIFHLVKSRAFPTRTAIFDSLPWKDKLLVQGYPPIRGNYDNPLPEDLPPEATNKLPEGLWEEKQAAARHAVEEVNKRLAASNEGPDDYDTDDDSCSDESCDGSPYCRCRECRRSKKSKGQARYDHALLALPNCLLFDTAFRIRWPRKCDAALCWCPCGSYMKPWQDFFGLTGTDEMEGAMAKCGTDGKKKKEPFALLAHLRKQGETCLLHYGVAVYLEKLYQNWNGTGLAHKDIYKNRNHKKYQEAESAENRRSRMVFTEMQEALLASEERERAMRKEIEESKKKMESLDKVNQEYKRKVEETRKVLHKLGLEKQEKEAELTDSDLKSYQLIFKDYVQGTKARAKKPRTPIKFVVPNNFSLQELFDDLDANDRDNSFLLRDLSFQKNFHHHAPKLVHDWKISFGAAIDEGGPTKAFLDQVWQQLPALKVKVGDVEVELFDFDEKSSKVVAVLPTSNEKIRLDHLKGVSSDAKMQIEEKAKRYYRAIGRIMFHSLMRDVVIASTAMPAFYRNVIFRECNLKEDRRYKYNKIIRDLQATGGNIAKQCNEMIGHPLSLYEIKTDIPDEKITKENFISKVVKHYYIDEKSIALEALQEGLTLNGYADLSSVLRIMPESAVSKLLFAHVKIEPQEVINILQPVYNSIEGIQEGQKHFFENVLPMVLRERSEEDEDFLRSFVSFVTGLSFVPHRLARPDYKILIEFLMDVDAPKARPQSKTCENVLLLPYHAYNSDRELFEELLDECLVAMKENNFSDE